MLVRRHLLHICKACSGCLLNELVVNLPAVFMDSMRGTYVLS